MYIPAEHLDPLPPAVAAFRKRGQPLLAWLVVLTIVGAIVWLRARPVPAHADAAPDEGSGLVALQMQSRYLVGAADLLKRLGQPTTDLAAQTSALNTGSISQRLRFIVLTGELAGPDAALRQLDELDRKLTDSPVQMTKAQQTLRSILRTLYADYAAGDWSARTVTDTDRADLRSQLHWFGELALAPAQGTDPAARAAALSPAHRTAAALLGFVMTLLVLGSFGLIGLFLFALYFLSGRLRLGLHAGSAAGGIYAETFALWMLLFLGLSLGANFVPAGQFRFAVLGGAMLLSLTALAWPVRRGISWRQVRHDIGLTLGRRATLEPILGIATYAMALPMLFVGVLITLVLLRLQGELHALSDAGGNEQFQTGDLPSHPIVDVLGRPTWLLALQVLFLAGVVAPLVEETMFRGVLYRHLREASAGLSRLGSIALSATIVSFIFAVIHPQGLATVPALMALAYAFTLAREWRGTLVPSMVAHGINNGLLLTLVILIMGT